MSVITLNTTEPTTTPAGLVWEAPPTLKRTSGKYAAIAAALQERPGEWAVLRTYAEQQRHRAWRFASVINSGKLIDFRNTPGGRFEAAARTVHDGSARVYVRYVPGLNQPEAA